MFDFSDLYIRQAYLQGVSLPNVNFRMAHFAQTLFTDTFGIIHTIAVSPDGNLIAAGTRGGDVRIWNIQDGSPTVTWHEHTDSVWCVAFSDDGELLASAGGDRTVRIWDLRTRRCVQVCRGHSESVVGVVFQPGKPVLATASNDNMARLWNALSGLELFQVEHDNLLRAVAFSGDGRHFASCSLDGTVRIWEANTGTCVAVFHDTRDNLSAITVSRAGDLVAAGCYDGTIQIWHWPTERKVLTVRGPSSTVIVTCLVAIFNTVLQTYCLSRPVGLPVGPHAQLRDAAEALPHPSRTPVHREWDFSGEAGSELPKLCGWGTPQPHTPDGSPRNSRPASPEKSRSRRTPAQTALDLAARGLKIKLRPCRSVSGDRGHAVFWGRR
jgi:WD domain, G-beta repeat